MVGGRLPLPEEADSSDMEEEGSGLSWEDGGEASLSGWGPAEEEPGKGSSWGRAWDEGKREEAEDSLKDSVSAFPPQPDRQKQAVQSSNKAILMGPDKEDKAQTPPCG